jgi:putative SOS response-associated peptidase YedK
MCNLYRNLKYGWTDWSEDFSELKIPLRFPEPLPNLLEEVRPTDPAAILRPLNAAEPAAGLEGVMVRWDLVPWSWVQPVKAKRFLATNARAETIATTSAFKAAFARRRCLIPADGFFEWTGEKKAKTRWLFTAAAQPWFCFAGIWDHADTADGPIDSCALLTTAAGADVASYHDRQPVILPREAWTRWLDLSADPRPLFAAGPAGTLAVEPCPAKPAAKN